MSDKQSIPVVDLTAFIDGSNSERQRIAQQVDEICRSIGFLTISNHGVSAKVIDAAWIAARVFFDLPTTQKIASYSADQRCPRGYFPIEGESLSKTRGVMAPPDRKEAFSSGPLAPPAGHEYREAFEFFYGPNVWPTEPAGFEETWTNYYLAMEGLGARIMQLLASALHLDDDYFVGFHAHHLSALRALNYPQTNDALQPGQQRAGAHSDYGSVTILKPDPDVGGLEVQVPTGEWITASSDADSFIVNIGDLMARWTNDRWVSTLHRVTDPDSPPGEPTPRRQSIAYFINPDYDAEISAIPTCVSAMDQPKHPPAIAGEYLMQQFNAAR